MRTGVFTEKVTLNDGTEIPQGTVCEIEEIYSFVMMDGEERVLNESIIERDGTLKTPYITSCTNPAKSSRCSTVWLR